MSESKDRNGQSASVLVPLGHSDFAVASNEQQGYQAIAAMQRQIDDLQNENIRQSAAHLETLETLNKQVNEELAAREARVARREKVLSNLFEQLRAIDLELRETIADVQSELSQRG